MARPRIIKSPEEMDDLVAAYVADCADKDKPITLTGMILGMGLAGRNSLEEYGRRSEFTHSVKKAKALIEEKYETQLSGHAVAGSIFALKNFGWKDTIVTDNTNRDLSISDEPIEDNDEWAEKYT